MACSAVQVGGSSLRDPCKGAVPLSVKPHLPPAAEFRMPSYIAGLTSKMRPAVCPVCWHLAPALLAPPPLFAPVAQSCTPSLTCRLGLALVNHEPDLHAKGTEGGHVTGGGVKLETVSAGGHTRKERSQLHLAAPGGGMSGRGGNHEWQFRRKLQVDHSGTALSGQARPRRTYLGGAGPQLQLPQQPLLARAAAR